MISKNDDIRMATSQLNPCKLVFSDDDANQRCSDLESKIVSLNVVLDDKSNSIDLITYAIKVIDIKLNDLESEVQRQKEKITQLYEEDTIHIRKNRFYNRGEEKAVDKSRIECEENEAGVK